MGETTSADGSAVSGGAVRILVVEDDPRIAGMLAKGLRAREYEVECVASGLAALERVARGDIDVQLLDLGLPDIDGLEVLRRMRHSGVSVPLIVITARSDPRDRAAALELGAREYLMKPFSWSALWAAVGDCVGDREPRSV